MTDFASIRKAMASLPSDHDASGEYRPTVDEIFTPDQHAGALDPNTAVVVGARGTGKSFWAGVLAQDDTRKETARAYPNLGLDRLVVSAGYAGLSADETPSAKVIDALVPKGTEAVRAPDFWEAVIFHAAMRALRPGEEIPSIRACMDQNQDPEDAARRFKDLDRQFADSGRTLLVTFDALDTISREWQRSSQLVDALFAVVWALRARRSIRAKIFIRPEQLNDESLRFIELPKLKSGRVELEWNQEDLYGLLYWRLAGAADKEAVENFRTLAADAGISVPADAVRGRRWPLLSDRSAQKLVMERLAGLFMGRTKKRGGTYDWPYKHLGDAEGKVTPRSFIKLFVEAAKYGQPPTQQVISADGIRHGLREASKVRVDQLGVEYKWVRRALAPLAGVTVPCEPSSIYNRWTESNTVDVILQAACDNEQGFLPPFPWPSTSPGSQLEELAKAMQRIGLLSYREDGRIDIPDLFRVAALMLKKGGTPPRQRR